VNAGSLAASQPNSTVTLPPEAASVALARKFVRQDSPTRLDEARIDLLAFLVSELATNAVLHARTQFVVSVEWRDDKVRVSVADMNVDPPLRKMFDPTAPTGRGLALVEAMASRWGFNLSDTGKTVWLELDIDEAA
jgi:anti-sigma regulatory factor (Ser/Thr protein kinase)